jgi:hypothetical protein
MLKSVVGWADARKPNFAASMCWASYLSPTYELILGPELLMLKRMITLEVKDAMPRAPYDSLTRLF